MTQDQKQKSKLIDTSILSKKRGKCNTNKLKENSCHVINNCCRLPALKEKKRKMDCHSIYTTTTIL